MIWLWRNLMKTAYVLLALATSVANVPVHADEYVSTGLNAYDVPVNARSIAMGESFVALTANPDALMFNPAGLAGFRGTEVSFALRRFDWSHAIDFRYFQAGGTVQTPFVNIGFLYNRFTSGELRGSTPQFPEGTGIAKAYNYALAIGLGKRFGDNWDIGVAFKTYDTGLTKVSGDVQETETSRPFLFDLGFIYSNRIPTEAESFSHAFSVGAAMQNIGGKLKSSTLSSYETDNEMSLAQYLRFGVTYSATVQGNESESLDPISILVSGEYRTFTNGAESQSSQKDFWGFGVEIRAFEIFAVRVSGYINPYGSVYGMKGTPALRYGLGLSLPLHKMSTTLPILVQVDYAGIPPQISNGYIGSQQPVTMRAFSISVRYVNELF